jgi:NNP family nitrate/nitrite transporter-like MFS transporter
MDRHQKATRITLGDFTTPSMRAFHTTWVAFFVCFFGWFGIAPLMAVVRDDLHLTKGQISSLIMASVTMPVLVRLVVGPLCDRYGARLTYTWLLLLGAVPVMGLGLASNYETFLLLRLAVGVIGASFVITQYHTSMMFAPNCVGTANATVAGWGNLGGGVTQIVMPLILAAFVNLGVDATLGWRLAMVLPGLALILMGLAYYRLTQDTPAGNFADLRASGQFPPVAAKASGTFRLAIRDGRVWTLAGIYAACFGVEITMHNVAALYYHDTFGLSVTTAGCVAGIFGLMNLFARALGGILSDRCAAWAGLKGRVGLLGVVLFCEGLALVLFSRMTSLVPAVAAMLVFGLCVKMASGATYGVVPFLKTQAVGAVAGIVGAGGNVGAVLAGWLFSLDALTTQGTFLLLGFLVMGAATLAFLVGFTPKAEAEERLAVAQTLTTPPDTLVTAN